MRTLANWKKGNFIACAALIMTFVGSTASSETLTVATWNLSNLSGDDLAGCHGRTQSDYDEIKRVINQVDADVWLF